MYPPPTPREAGGTRSLSGSAVLGGASMSGRTLILRLGRKNRKREAARGALLMKKASLLSGGLLHDLVEKIIKRVQIESNVVVLGRGYLLTGGSYGESEGVAGETGRGGEHHDMLINLSTKCLSEYWSDGGGVVRKILLPDAATCGAESGGE